MIKSFWKKYNGAQGVLIWLPALFISTLVLKAQMDIPYPFWEVVLNLVYGVSKIFLAEFIGSVLLQVNQPLYFAIVHEPESLDIKCNTPGFREAAFKTYYAYILLSGLVLAFA
jgi:hypothetical protein